MTESAVWERRHPWRQMTPDAAKDGGVPGFSSYLYAVISEVTTTGSWAVNRA